jgi:hypothetical protein
MLQDILESLPDTLATMPDGTHDWTCVGVVPVTADAEILRVALGNGYELRAEPFEGDIAAPGGHPWVHGARHWEVWVRPV